MDRVGTTLHTCRDALLRVRHKHQTDDGANMQVGRGTRVWTQPFAVAMVRPKLTHTWAVLLIMMFALLPTLAFAQETDDAENALADGEIYPGIQDTGVYVTTQDFLSFRSGPNTAFERLDVIAPETTLPAIGRTADTRWVQVVYGEDIGWVAVRFVVYSGDVVQLPVDGINPLPFIRRAGAVGFLTRDTPIYSREITPEDQVGVLPAGTRVEFTGRLGSGGFFRLQILHEGQLYWVGAWNVRVTDGEYRRLFDTAYLFPYGRLLGALDADVSRSISMLDSMSFRWSSVATGEGASCERIPGPVSRTLVDGDVSAEPIFSPAVIALDEANVSINASIAAFEDACGRGGVTQAELVAMSDELAEARRNLTVARALLGPLRLRNPLLSIVDDTSSLTSTGGF